MQAWASDLSLPDGAGAARQDRSRFPEARLRQAHVEFRLVGQSQGPLRQEPVRRRVSRAGQYRRVRPQRAIADRRPSGAGRRHGLGGPVLPEHARDRRSSLRRTTRPTRNWQPTYAMRIPADRPRDERDRPGRHVGRGGRLLLRCPAPARRERDAAQGPLDGGPAAALRRDIRREVAAGAGPQTDGANARAHAAHAGTCANPSMRPGRGISASRSAASLRW